MTRHSETAFLNVDLDIYSRSSLEPLVTALGRHVIVLFLGIPRRMYEAHLEIAGIPKSADQVIRKFVRLIDALPPAARKHWDRANRRDFSIGVEAGTERSVLDIAIESETVAAAARLNARIVITVYTAQPPAGQPPSR